jgi:hypothetical protein
VCSKGGCRVDVSVVGEVPTRNVATTARRPEKIANNIRYMLTDMSVFG